jgi:O-antigen/teichoic acid export membrane protein
LLQRLSKDSDHKEVYALVMKYFVKVMLFVALGIVANLSWIGYFVGEEYRTGLVIVPWLILANFFLGVYFNLSVWYKLTDKTIYGSLIAIAGALLTLILNYLLIPKVGYTGAAITTFVCYLTMALVSYFLGQKYFLVPYDIKSFLVEFALFMVAMVYIWQNPHFLANSWIHLLWKNLILVLFGVFLWQRTTRDKHQSIL